MSALCGLHTLLFLFAAAGLMEQLVVACVAHMKDVALSKSCMYMEAKHTGDKLLLEQVPSGDAAIKNIIRITMRRKVAMPYLWPILMTSHS